jgi:hypothetical protein
LAAGASEPLGTRRGSRVVNAAQLRRFQRAPELFFGQRRSILQMAAAMKPAPDWATAMNLLSQSPQFAGPVSGPEMSPAGATTTSTEVVGDVCSQEAAKLISTADMGRVADGGLVPLPDW